MTEQSTAAVTEQQDAVKANWAALKDWDKEVVPEQPKTPEEVQNKDVKDEEKSQDVKLELNEDKPEEKPAEKSAETETKPEDKPTETPENETLDFELKPEDVKDVPQTFDDGDWRGVAADLGFEAKENSWEDFVAAHNEKYVTKEEYNKALEVSKEAIYAQFPPEIAAALKLADLGIPKELIFEPTKEIEGYLALDNTALVKADLLAQKYTEDLAEAKITKLIEDDKLDTEANLLRFELNKQKENIINQRNQLVSQREAEIAKVQQQAKEKEIAQINEALNNTSDFLGVPLSKATKELLAKKIQSGAYEKELSTPNLKLAAILQKEFGSKYAEYAKNKFRSEGKSEVIKKLANVPPKSGVVGSTEKPEQPENNDNWAALKTWAP